MKNHSGCRPALCAAVEAKLKVREIFAFRKSHRQKPWNCHSKLDWESRLSKSFYPLRGLCSGPILINPGETSYYKTETGKTLCSCGRASVPARRIYRHATASGDARSPSGAPGSSKTNCCFARPPVAFSTFRFWGIMGAFAKQGGISLQVCLFCDVNRVALLRLSCETKGVWLTSLLAQPLDSSKKNCWSSVILETSFAKRMVFGLLD